jgi:hypothetical protein
MKSSSFASTSAQRGKFALPQQSNPGAGAYSPAYSATMPEVGNLVSKTGREHKFPSDNLDGVGNDSSTQPHVGPGSYNSHAHKTISKSDSTKVSKQSKAAAASTPGAGALGFGSKYSQRELPHEEFHGKASEAEATPGPGQYEPRVTELGSGLTSDAATKESFNTQAKLGKQQFMSQSTRAADTSPDKTGSSSGDLNAYNPNVNREIAYDAKRTFQTGAKVGKANFGGTEKRTLLMSNQVTKIPSQGWTGSIEDTPGPAAYDSLVDEKGREHSMHKQSGAEKMKSSSFASTSAQRGKFALPQQSNPGAGAYSPAYSAMMPEVGNLVSKTGRDHHFPSDNLDGVGNDSSTQPHVGPGSYNSHLAKTISYDLELLHGELPHASFISESFRTIYTGQNE